MRARQLLRRFLFGRLQRLEAWTGMEQSDVTTSVFLCYVGRIRSVRRSVKNRADLARTQNFVFASSFFERLARVLACRDDVQAHASLQAKAPPPSPNARLSLATHRLHVVLCV